MSEVLKSIYDAILEGNATAAKEGVTAALESHMDASLVLNEGMIKAMAEVGRLFEEGEYFVPEMLISARAMQAGLSVLKPALKKADVQSAGKVVIGTVQGDLHDIGKNLVAMMLEGSGFEIIDLGTDVPSEKFVDTLKSHEANILAMSALLTTTMPRMKDTILALEAAGLRTKVKIMVGGAPVTENYAKSIGADGFASDASKAVNLAKSLLN
jgi:5-methyltetrahydrofolate--homocysteine methyltransferase